MGNANPQPLHLQYCLEGDLLESSFAQIDLVDKLNMSQQRALAAKMANSALDFI